MDGKQVAGQAVLMVSITLLFRQPASKRVVPADNRGEEGGTLEWWRQPIPLSKTPQSHNGLSRLVNNLARTEFFTQFCEAFTRLTSLSLSLEAAGENEEFKQPVTEYSIAGVATTHMPEKLGKTL